MFTLLTIVLSAEEEVAGFALLLFGVPIAIVALAIYLVFPTFAVYKLTKKTNTYLRITALILYLGLFALLVADVFTLTLFSTSQFVQLGNILLLSIPLTYPLGIWCTKKYLIHKQNTLRSKITL